MRNAKKILSIITAGMLLFCGACDETGTTDGGKKPAPAPETEHVHEWLLIEESKATCTHDGYEKFECECGEIEEKTHEKLEHTYSKTETIQATCINSGSVTYACECGASYIETSPMLDHEYELISETPATCTAQGIEQYECGLCGGTKAVSLPMVDHEYELISSTEPTGDQDGVEEYECKDCEATKTVTITHIHEWVVIDSIEATCLKDGLYTYKCDYCDATKEEIAVKGTWGHMYVLTNKTTPSTPTMETTGCQDTWTETYKCVHCEDEYSITAGGGHTEEMDIIQYIICSQCKSEEAMITKCQDCDYKLYYCPICRLGFEY